MTEPLMYQTKPAHEVSAIQYDGSSEAQSALHNWVAGFSTESANVQSYTTPMGVLVVQDGDFTLQAGYEQYVYLDEDGFHVASKGAFEMYYKKVPDEL